MNFRSPFPSLLGRTSPRCLSPRTDNYEQTLVDLLDSPSVRPKGVITSATISEVLGRVDLLVSDSTEEIATRMLLDRAVMGEVERRTGNNRLRFVDGAIDEKGRELHRELQEVKEAVEAERRARETSEKEVVVQAERLQLEEDRRLASEERAKKVEMERRVEMAEVAARASDSQKRMDEAARRHDEAQQAASGEVGELRAQVNDQAALLRLHERIIRWSVSAVLVLMAIAVVIVPDIAGWATGGLPLALTIAGAFGLCALGLRWHLGRKKAAFIITAVIAVLSLISALRSFTGESNGDSHDSSGQAK
jgi:hypothetical protein